MDKERQVIKIMQVKGVGEIPYLVEKRSTLQFKGDKVETVISSEPRLAHPMPLDTTKDLLQEAIKMGVTRHRLTEGGTEAIKAVLEGKSDIAIIPSPTPQELIEGTSLTLLASSDHYDIVGRLAE